MSVKSLIVTTKFTKAQREHKCKANKKHIISQNDLRLEVKNERSWDKYCMHCAAIIIKKMQRDSSLIADEFTALK
ncbi:hypothetical protein [Photobacterium iliopiscarium]|uniref:Uncharacterized protein n=1 Tax=Photobacterium iliopiscarium TaxID=56192 RepID=A0A2T3M7G2_9GAMM|nr:hypothetical protein [Photobacterium iliopiscarium]PSV88150.1 hypothetical protein C9I88_19955 [Photobacterium iliopiscarium]